MSDPNHIPPPLTVEELQERLRSGEFRIEAAPSELVDHYDIEIRRILIAIGRFMGGEGEDDPASQEDAEEWADGCFVSDMSSVSDFMPDDNQLAVMSTELGVPVAKQDYIYAVAARMKGAN